MRKQIILVLLTVMILIFAQEKSIKQIKQEFNSLKDNNSRIELASSELKKFQIKAVEDLTDVTEISEVCLDLLEDQKSFFQKSEDFDSDYSDLMNDCYASFEKIQENDKYLEPKLLELMKKGEDETRLYAIKALGTIKSKKAAPEFRKKIKGFSRTKFNALKLVSQVRAYKYLFEAAISAESLGSVAEESDYQMLVDRFYDLEGATGKGLLKMERKGFMTIVDMARNEKEKHEDGYAFIILRSLSDEKYLGYFTELFSNNIENEAIRDIALSNIINLHNKGISDNLLIEKIKNEYKNYNWYYRCIVPGGLKRETDIPFLLSILENEEDKDILKACIRNLENMVNYIDIPISVIAAIEKIIYTHRSREVVSYARNALLSFGEKESLERLKKSLIENNGDEVTIERIQKRIQTGRKGPDYYDDYSEEYYYELRKGSKK